MAVVENVSMQRFEVRETVLNILRDAVLYSALVAVGGSWATFIRESSLLLIPQGFGGEVVAVVFTTFVGAAIAIVAGLSMYYHMEYDEPSVVEKTTPAHLDSKVTILMRNTITSRAMRPKGMIVPERCHREQQDARPVRINREASTQPTAHTHTQRMGRRRIYSTRRNSSSL